MMQINIFNSPITPYIKKYTLTLIWQYLRFFPSFCEEKQIQCGFLLSFHKL